MYNLELLGTRGARIRELVRACLRGSAWYNLELLGIQLKKGAPQLCEQGGVTRELREAMTAAWHARTYPRTCEQGGVIRELRGHDSSVLFYRGLRHVLQKSVP